MNRNTEIVANYLRNRPETALKIDDLEEFLVVQIFWRHPYLAELLMHSDNWYDWHPGHVTNRALEWAMEDKLKSVDRQVIQEVIAEIHLHETEVQQLKKQIKKLELELEDVRYRFRLCREAHNRIENNLVQEQPHD